MAKRRDTTNIAEKQFKSIREIDIGIEKFRRRIEEVKALDPQKVPYDSQERRTVEEAIAATIRDVVGPHSPEANEHQYYKIWHGCLNTTDGDRERQQKFAAGIPEAVTFLEGFTKRLEEKKLHFVPPSPQVEAPGIQRSPPKIEQHFHGQVSNVAAGTSRSTTSLPSPCLR